MVQRRTIKIIAVVFIFGLLIGVLRIFRIPGPLYSHARKISLFEKAEKASKGLESQGKAGFTFLACGDPGDGYGTFAKIRNRMKEEKDPAFAVILGDLVKYGTRTRHDILRREIHDFPLPVLVIPGDHDYSESGSLGNFIEIWGEQGNRPLKFANAVLIIVQASGPEGFSELEFDKLEEGLESLPGGEIRIVLIHEPPFDPRFKPGEKDGENFFHFGKKKSEHFHAIARENGVSAVISGHLHGYFHHERDGIQYIITGGAGSKFIDYNPKNTNFFHYVRMKAAPQGVTHDVVRVDAPLREGWHFEGIRYLAQLNLYLLSKYPDFLFGAIGLIVLIVAVLSPLAFSAFRPETGKVARIAFTALTTVISAMVLFALYLVLIARF
ncbi:MAG: metallophosphoesterase family protein [Planctomycetota bacterium]|jgi:predicted phosphodiesterase